MWVEGAQTKRGCWPGVPIAFLEKTKNERGGAIMHSFIRQKALIVISIVPCLFLCSVLRAEPVQIEQAQRVIHTFLQECTMYPHKGPETISAPAEREPSIMAAQQQGTPGQRITGSFREIRGDDGAVLAYIVELKPRGFVAASTDTDITPIIAYSFSTYFPADNDKNNPLYRMLKGDMKLRLKALAEYEQFKTMENNNLWNFYAGEDTRYLLRNTFQQWPQENTTSTGGWLETAWDQDSPYNDFCPLDPIDGTRSYVGCVATAFAQVVNYHQQCNVHFDELDSYIPFSGINIDGDSSLYDFPSFQELNEYLAAVRLKYSRQIELDDTDVAALSFACGIAVNMDYSSEGSGASPFDLQNALLDKFGFYSADMTGGLSCEYYHVLQENLINQLPALLSISPPDGWGGHMLVCDGYNTNGEYHLNFGWGSSRPEEITEVWYRLPSDLPSNYSIISETILNVQPVTPSIKVDPATFLFYAVPGQESEPKTLFIRNNTAQPILINSISSPEGFLVSRLDGGDANHIDSFQIKRPGQEASINVKFCPQEAGGYYGTLTISYGDENTKHVILKGCAFTGGTEVKAGEVSGTWSQAQSPYFVVGDVNVPENGELIIEPGVKVLFLGRYSMSIGKNARLAAQGNENHPIEFTALNREMGWTGLRFLDSGEDDILSYCSITFSKKTVGLITEEDYYADYGDKDNCGGALYCYFSSPTITNCKITNNIGDSGGAIYCAESYPVISNTVIANNASLGGLPRCGGICSDWWGAPEIRNCTIVNNVPGGIFTTSWEEMNVTNTIIWGNEQYQIETQESTPVVSFCDVQGGYRGQGNMDADPCFFAPSAGAGPDYDGLSANWTLRSSSPCINSGTEIELPATDLAGSPRIYSDIVDMGAYENQSDLPLITIAPSATVEAGFVPIDTNSTMGIDIKNTGKIDFKVERLSISDPRNVFSILTPLDNYILAPGDSVRVEIGFRPTKERVYNGIFHVYSTSSNAPQKWVTLRGVGVAGTIVPGGAVSGTWTKAQSPYSITGDIRVPKGRTLTIEPGVVVKFTGHFGLTVGYRATLRATGTEQDHIVITAIDTDEGWFGIRFVNSGTDDILKYCTVEYSKKPRTGGGGYLNLLGGGILCCGSWEEEPGFLVPSSPTIDHCLIANNHAETAGGIMCMDESEAVITNNMIVDNSADLDVGGIYIFEASVTIANNVIAHNSGLQCGGIMNWWGSASVINNTIAHNRPNALHLGPTMWIPWGQQGGLPVLNNIIWQNEIYLGQLAYPEDYDVRFNDIQGGWEGEGNIDVDPLFVDPDNRDYHLKSQAGRWDPIARTWVRDDGTSPCIDVGDPDADWTAELPPNGQRINMGAFGGTIEASLSVSPAGNLADLNNDGSVDYADIMMLAKKWLNQGLLAEDIDRNGAVGFGDFCIIATSWLRQSARGG